MAVPFMSRQSGFNNNNKFGNQRSLTPGGEGPYSSQTLQPGMTSPRRIAPGMSPGFRNAASPAMTSATTALNAMQSPARASAPPAAPRMDGRLAGIAAMRSYVNPAANGPTKPMRAPSGPGASQSYGGFGAAQAGTDQGQFVDRSGQLQSRSAVPNMSPARTSFDANGRPNGSPAAAAEPRVKASFKDPGAKGPNKALSGMTSKDFRSAQATFAQRRGLGTGTPNTDKAMPSLSPEAKRIIGNQGAVADANMKKYGTDNAAEASRAMWRERAFRQRNTASRQAGYRNDPVAIQQVTDNYMGRGVDPRSMQAEPFRRADAEWARGSVQGQKPFIKPDPASSNDPKVSGQRPSNKRPGHSGGGWMGASGLSTLTRPWRSNP